MGIEEDLFKAICNNSVYQVRELLYSINDINNIQDNDGDTPLHSAVICSCYSILGMLVLSGAEVDIQNNRGWTPLHLAVLVNNPYMVNVLLELCAKFYKKDIEGNLSIHLAAKQGYSDIVEILLEKNTVNAKNKAGFTPLHLAINGGHEDAVRILINYGFVDIDIRDKEGKTALDIAIEKGCKSIAKCLLSYGAGTFAATEKMRNVACQFDESSDISYSDESMSIPCISEPSTHKRKALSSISNASSSGSSLCKAHVSKRRRLENGSKLLFEEFSDNSSKSLSSQSANYGDTSEITSPESILSEFSRFTLDISSPGSSVSSSTVSKCRRFLSALNLHYSEHSFPEPLTSKNVER